MRLGEDVEGVEWAEDIESLEVRKEEDADCEAVRCWEALAFFIRQWRYGGRGRAIVEQT